MVNYTELKNEYLVDVEDFGRRPTSQRDISALIHIIDMYCSKDILEIGTWYGKTTYELAKKFPEKVIYTMDYMEKDLVLSEVGMKTRASKEDLCKYAKHLLNVSFLYENSHTSDFSKIKSVDCIFVDGNHSLPGVQIDTDKSIEYLKRNGGGVIIWHDINNTGTDVPRYVKEEVAKNYDVTCFLNTMIGYTLI